MAAAFKIGNTIEVCSKYYPGGFYGHDRDGRPVFIQPFGTMDIKGLMHSVRIEDLLLYKRTHCEHAANDCKKREEMLGVKLKNHSTVIIDMEGLGKKQLWLPGLKSYQAIIDMLENEYPDGSEHVILINTPLLFHRIFPLVKPLLPSKSKDKIKVLGSSWKTDILKYIAADNLPEHYGGTCKDDNGSPKCEQYICYGGEIPRSYYIIENIDQGEFITATARAGKTIKINKDVKEPGSTISYQFISNLGIGFSVHFEDTIIIPNSIISSHIMMEWGEVECVNTGRYVFIFDNTASRFTKKEVNYQIEITKD